MRPSLRPFLPWLAAWLLLAVAGGWVLGASERDRQRSAFDNDVRIAHRLLSQRAAQHDAILATLALLQPAPGADGVQRLPALYPQILAVRQLAAGEHWAFPAFEQAQQQSLRERRPVLAAADLVTGRAWLVLAAEPASFALQVDLVASVPWTEWPMPRLVSPVRVLLLRGDQALVLQPGRTDARGPWQFALRKPLASPSQPFELVALRAARWSELPWGPWGLWAVFSAALVGAAAAVQRQRSARRRAEELLRLGQVARLNTLGELAGGLAHELNQPLTAVLANTQAARRLLAEQPPELDPARAAMGQAAEQARRASDVVARLRRTIERPAADAAMQPVVLQDAVRNAFDLLEPEFARREVAPRLHGPAPVRVHAEPVALEQIVHNLLMNALQALDQVPAAQRELSVDIEQRPEGGVLSVADSGPGIAPELLPRIFDPFVSTREHGLGLGLSLCDSLASGMGGTLQALQRAPRGALFRLTLPAA
ncbi:MAG TPA: ATP-binding protein [Ramlibacter sp.]|jgi:signal transduction histidine kinase|uniref:sensor histidine kinase n=1 Tax=Ramlibacter sp. TaxID=1917967 RepID=UPI002D5A1F06|nr:ATP-binding protein [Ramlibacter sp.]HZY18841.1 ATP-binding protein [Ramlibacter sp.]